jgi:hypothetical protein
MPRTVKRCASATQNSTDASSTVSRTYLFAVSRATVPAANMSDACAFSFVAAAMFGLVNPGM